MKSRAGVSDTLRRMLSRTIKVKDLKPGDGFLGEERRPGRKPEVIPYMEKVVSVTACYNGASTEYVCTSGRLYFGRSDSDIQVWR
jgi:hypothetical protein